MSLRSLLGATALVLVTAACGDDGRVLAPASPTTSTTVAPPASSASDGDAMRLTSPDVTDGDRIDPRLTCEGGDEAPVLVLTGAPIAAAELAVAVVDLDADGFVHLVVAGLPADTDVLDVASPPDGAVLGRSTNGVEGWDAPCPPPGDRAHRYEFRAYAMAEATGLAAGTDGRDAVAVLEAASLERATLTATYP